MTNQIGGDHYQEFAIQPWEYNTKNNLGWGEGEIVKYVTRWKKKNGAEDLRKAKSIIEFLIQSSIQENDKQLPLPINRPLMEYELTEHDVTGLV